jgi:magnesium chelatase subunit I
MSDTAIPPIMPYSMVVGQDQTKLALELSYIAPRIGGVLISGQRGTGKSTIVRAFAQMMYEKPLVTLPINATEDRVVGGWQIKKLMDGQAQMQDGLLKEADKSILYVDEVNLLDDHIVNIILDVASTGALSIQRDGLRAEERVRFSLVGTMNPEEGLLRPQLLDRFGLMVYAEADKRADHRAEIINTVLTYDAAQAGEPESVAQVLMKADEDRVYAERLRGAPERLLAVQVGAAVDPCVRVATAFEMQGHRSGLVMLTAARALAALESMDGSSPRGLAVELRHLEAIA